MKGKLTTDMKGKSPDFQAGAMTGLLKAKKDAVLSMWNVLPKKSVDFQAGFRYGIDLYIQTLKELAEKNRKVA